MAWVEALWTEAERLLAPHAAATLLAWGLVAILALAVIVLLVRLRRTPDAVEQVFVASAIASRRSREISEIDAFARRAAATAEELKAHVRKLRAGHFRQVKIYIDHSNFIKTWTSAVHGRDRQLEHDVDWANLPLTLTEALGAWLGKGRKGEPSLVYRGTNVYGTLFQADYFALLETMLRLEKTKPDRLALPIRLREETVERWRAENEAYKIELMQTIVREVGYQVVPILRRTPREDQLFSCNYTAGGIPIAPEKMLDTHLATDLVGDATFDVFDIALLVTEDSDFVPAVDFVQEMRGKHVVHVGFGGHSNDLREKCWHRIDLRRDQLFKRLQRSRKSGADGAKVVAAPESVPAAVQEADGGRPAQAGRHA